MRNFPRDWTDLGRDDFLGRWYAEHYTNNAYSGAQGLLQRWMHRSIEPGKDQHYSQILELGADVGQHLPYVRHPFDQYIATDSRQVVSERYSDQRGGVVSFQIEDAHHLSFQDQQFDRVLCGCVLHHLFDPETAMMEIRRVLKIGGRADLFVSSDPGLMFRFARKIGPYRTAKKNGLGKVKQLVDARDHVGHALGILRLAKFVFREDDLKIETYPIPNLGWNLSLWSVVRVRRK